jgi:hypothetical protein
VDLSERKRVRVENRQRDAIDAARVPDRMVVALTVLVLMVVVQIHLNAAQELRSLSGTLVTMRAVLNGVA